MKFNKITENKKEFLPLLLLADEQESMIDGYLFRGDLWALEDDGVKAVCVVTDEGNGVGEVQNLAVDEAFQRRGYGRALLAEMERRYAGIYHTLQLGTGDSPMTVPFYQTCGFTLVGRRKDYFRLHYGRPIYENGVELRDRVDFAKKI